MSPEKTDLNPTKMIWTPPKRFGPNQNNLYSSSLDGPKSFWTYDFGPIEGQGIKFINLGFENIFLNLVSSY